MLKIILVSSVPNLDKKSQTQFEQKIRKKVGEMNKQKKHEEKIFLFFIYSEEKLNSQLKKNGIKGILFINEEQLFVYEKTNFIKNICYALKKETIPVFLWVKEGYNRFGNDVIIVKNITEALTMAVNVPPIPTAY